MNEILTELKAYRAEAFCECGGKFVPSGVALLTNPPKYPHYCNKCNAKDVFPNTYPKVVYK
jgi:hypothetical protein